MSVLVAASVQIGSAFSQRPDEALYHCVSAALRDAGLRKPDVDLSVVASRDLYDACSMSNGQTLPAAAGWLTGSVTRLETDISAAIVLADAVLSAGDAEIAVVSGVHLPQAYSAARSFDEQVSNLAAEPIYERAVGLSATSLLAMHAARLVTNGTTTQHELAAIAARELGIDVEAVLSSAPVAWPLTDLMLPAETTGAVALVLATPERAQAMGMGRARIVAHGMAASGALADGEWLEAPHAATERAARDAYRRAGIVEPASEIDVAELTAASPAMHEPLRRALQLSDLADDRIGGSGGVRRSFGGVVNGALRLLGAIESLERDGGRRAVVHSTDTLTGPLGATTTVTVLERI
ncbi:hypothetical protein [Nocardia fluminea]|uniref:hypothetical protein n=1 Tax=Nocardia fluminea TaxID=134984 RepID=UPI0037964D83